MDSFQRIKLGAIDKKNGLFTSPFKANKANKENEYKCPDCDNDVILKQGDIRKYHFSHKPDSDCSYYNAGETAIHKYGCIWESKLKKWKVPNNKTQLESLQNFLDNL